MDNTAEVQINLVSTDNASGNILAAGDALDTLNQKTIKATKNSEQKITELGGKFKAFKEVSSNAMNTAVSSGAITGEMAKIAPVVGGASAAFGSLLTTGFTPLNIAITGAALALPLLIKAFSDSKPSLDSLAQSFDNFKKSIKDANAQLFDAQSQMRNIRNSGLDVYLKEATQYFQDIEKANKRVKENATANAKDIALQYIKEFERAGVQSSKLFEAFKIPDDVKSNLKDFKSSITQGVFDSQNSVFKSGAEAVNKYGGTIKATFQSEEIVKYFEQSKLAGKDFDSSFSWISNKILGLNNLNSKSFQDASTVQGKFYLDLKKQMQDYYDAYKINNDKVKAEAIRVEIEKAQKSKADYEKYLGLAIEFNKKKLSAQIQFDSQELRRTIENQMALIEKRKIIQFSEIQRMYINEEQKAVLREKANQEALADEQEFVKNYTEGMAAFAGAAPKMEIQPPDKSAWDEFRDSFSLAGIGAEIDSLNPKMNASKEAAGLMHAAVNGAAKSMSNAFVQLGATGKLSLASLGNAIKQSVAVEMQAISAKSMVWALYETARGFAALFMNPAEAGAHFQSAGLFTATAVAAGVGAGVIGGGGSTSSNNSTSVADTPKTDTSSETKTEATIKTTEININVSGNMNKGATEDVLEAMQNLGEIINSRDLSGASAA